MIGGILVVTIVLVFIAVIVISLFLKRHGESTYIDANWLPTEEVFRDPSTDRLMRVYVDRRNGQRHYIHERNIPFTA